MQRRSVANGAADGAEQVAAVVDEVDPPGTVADAVGGASSRMNMANCTVSLSVPMAVVLKLVRSSGVALMRHCTGSPTPVETPPSSPGSGRSCVKSSLLTPISTLYASPAKISSDLFCAFHPKRLMVPSLPL